MRVALDATYSVAPQPTGVARYSRRLVESLAATDLVLTLAARPRSISALKRTFPNFQRRILQEPFRFLLPRDIDIFHGLNQRLPALRFRRTVTTIHDIFPLSSDRYSSPEFNSKFSKVIRDAVSRSDALIAVSAYTRDEICRVLGVDPAKITVVHHGIDPAAMVARETPDEPYLLTVGVVQTRKNTLAAVRTIERLPPRVRLIVAGGVGYGAEATQEYVRRAGLASRVEFAGHCDEAALDRLYAGASALLFPSYEEGFGFPVLEAMARGVPVIAARTSSIPEIAGDAAQLFDPDDDRGMADAAARILEDSAWAKQWSEKGRRHARQFTWERCAQETLAVYRQLVS